MNPPQDLCCPSSSLQNRRECPLEIKDEIVGLLEGDLRSLGNVRLASKNLSCCSPTLLFRDVSVHSVHRLLHLQSLLSSSFCGGPTQVRTLTIHLDLGNTDFDGMTVHDAVLDVLEHFDRGATAILSLSLPWMISRGGGIWEYTQAHRGIRKFVLSGVYSWITDVAEALSHMEALESLTVNASWKLDQVFAREGAGVPLGLKEIGLSESSLALLLWMCSLENGPTGLDVVRIQVDGVSSHHLSFAYLRPFFRKFGSRIRRLSFWFEDCPDHIYEGMTLSACVSRVRRRA